MVPMEMITRKSIDEVSIKFDSDDLNYDVEYEIFLTEKNMFTAETKNNKRMRLLLNPWQNERIQ